MSLTSKSKENTVYDIKEKQCICPQIKQEIIKRTNRNADRLYQIMLKREADYFDV